MSSFSLAQSYETLVGLAVEEFLGVLEMLDENKPYECKEILLGISPSIVNKYGLLAAKAAAEDYDQQRLAVLGNDSFLAPLAQEIDKEVLLAKIRWIIGPLFEEDDDGS